MPRSEILSDGDVVHLSWQCHGKSFLFQDRWAKELYYDILLAHKERYGIRIYAYCFMDSQAHMILHIEKAIECSRFLQICHAKFARRFNKKAGRNSAFFRDRARTKVVKDDSYLKTLLLYFDTNPAVTAQPQHPKTWEFSSYQHYAVGKEDLLLDECEAYQGLGSTPQDRQATYTALVEESLDAKSKPREEHLRIAQPGYYYGDDAWVTQQESALKERLLQRQERMPTTREWPAPWNAGLRKKP